MSQQPARYELRVPLKLKTDVGIAIANLGYKNISEFMRDVFSIVAYGSSHVTISEELPRIMSVMTRPYMSTDEAKQLKEEFVQFLSAPANIANWLLISYRTDEDTFLTKYVLRESEETGDYLDNEFQTDYFAYTGHSMTPEDAKALVHAYYNDPEIRKTMRDHFTARQRQKLVERSRDKIEEEAQ